MPTMFMIWSLLFSAMAILAPLEILAAHSHLEEGFYSDSCPFAEHIVWKAVSAAVRKDPTIPAAIIRLYFHDCFVRVRYNSLVSTCRLSNSQVNICYSPSQEVKPWYKAS